MLEGDDEFGFEQFTDDDFQSSDFGTGGIQDFGIQPGQDRLDSMDSQYESTDQYLEEGAFSEETESTLKDLFPVPAMWRWQSKSKIKLKENKLFFSNSYTRDGF